MIDACLAVFTVVYWKLQDCYIASAPIFCILCNEDMLSGVLEIIYMW